MKYSEITEGPLQRPNLLKNPARMQALINKIETGSPFTLRGEEMPSVKITQDPELLDNLKKGIIPDIFPLEDGRQVRLSGLEKTGEFGGKGAGFSTRDEDAALTQINEMLEQMKQGKSEVNLVIGDKTVPVAKFVSTQGTPKSDFHAVDASGNEVAWISHKKGSKARDFGQWGGMSDREMKIVYANMPEAKEEILKFAKDVIAITNGEIPRATTYARKIQNGKLRGIAIYGNGFGGERGHQNVDLILQGEPQFKGNKLVATGSAHTNGERLEDEFEPVLMAMYKGDRDNFGVKGARFSIYPAGGRKISEWI
jgi:hypothetical protein